MQRSATCRAGRRSRGFSASASTAHAHVLRFIELRDHFFVASHGNRCRLNHRHGLHSSAPRIDRSQLQAPSCAQHHPTHARHPRERPPTCRHRAAVEEDAAHAAATMHSLVALHRKAGTMAHPPKLPPSGLRRPSLRAVPALEARTATGPLAEMPTHSLQVAVAMPAQILMAAAIMRRPSSPH